MYAAKTPHPYVPEWKKMDMEKKQQSKNRDIEKVLNELLGEYQQDPTIKIQFITKSFFKSVASDAILGNTLRPGIADTEKFQAEYKELIKFLMNRMKAATDENPAEKFLHPLEIKLVILEDPKLLLKCDELSDNLQRFAYGLSRKNIQYIRHPLPSLVGGFLHQFPFEIDKIPTECITPEQTINAILKDQLSIQKFDKPAFLKSMQQNGSNGLTTDQLMTFINKNRGLFTDDDFKVICRVAVAKNNRQLFNSIFALVPQPDNDLIKSMIALAPNQIGTVKKADIKLQKLALKSAYKSHQSLKNVYDNIEKPSTDVTEYYQLLSLYCNRDFLRDLDSIYKSFEHPSEKVTEKYRRYKLDYIYRWGDFYSFLGFESPSLSDNMKQRWQRCFLIAAHIRFPHRLHIEHHEDNYKADDYRLSEVYEYCNDYPMPDGTHYLYAILTAANSIIKNLDPSARPSDRLGSTELKILSDLITAAKRYSVTEQQLFGDKFWLIQEWIKNQKTK